MSEFLIITRKDNGQRMIVPKKDIGAVYDEKEIDAPGWTPGTYKTLQGVQVWFEGMSGPIEIKESFDHMVKELLS